MNMASPFRFRSLSALLALAFATNTAGAAIYTVGSGSGCTHPTFNAAITSAEINPGADTIRLTRSIAYTQVAESITTAQELDIVGGFATCAQTTPDGGMTTLDGSGGATEPVLRITGETGARIRLSQLTIRGGDEDGSGKGGGIYFRGNGILELDHSVITQNIAGHGGGIYAEGTGSATELVIGEDVEIVANTARFDGGGVVNDGTEMTMIQADSYIANNHAPNGYGGGLLVRSGSRPAYTYLGSSGFGNAGPIYLNDARRGGGAAVLGSSHRAELHLFSTDPARPVRIRGNTASVDGGGVSLGQVSGADSGYASLKTWYAYIDENIAPNGAAIAVRDSSGGAFGVYFNVPAQRPLGSIDCPIGKPCGGIIDNAAINAASQPTGGSVEVSGFGFTRFHNAAFEGNSGKFLFRGDGNSDGGLGFETHHVAITGNSTSNALVVTENDSDHSGFFEFHDTTIAGNAIGADTVLRISNVAAGVSKLHRSIIWQPGKTTLQLSGPPLDLLDSMVSERASVDGGNTPYVVEQNPRFVDPASGDYSLRAGSPAIDATGAVANDARDLLSNPRDVDLAGIENFRGIRDIGAFERQAVHPLVLNADFDADLRLWGIANAGVTTYDPTRNMTGAAGSGSAHISVPSAVTGTTTGGIVQCVHLPGPGTYALNGWGRGTGSALVVGDSAQLYWEFRKSGGEGCTGGTPNANGTKVLSNSNSWSRPATPTLITVSALDWTYTSSIAITLVAREFGPAGAPTNAWFDGITLDFLDGDRIFADDFDP